MTRVIVSGVHSDDDPSPGLGIARSLRAAGAQLDIVGVDYSSRSTGLHDSVFDSVEIKPVWSEMDLEAYLQQILEEVEAGSYRFACLDAEVHWLAQHLPEHERVLIPPKAALNAAAKPHIRCADRLGMSVPTWLPADAAPLELEKLARRSGWRAWMKGHYHDALRVRDLRELFQAREALAEHWGLDHVFLQAHVNGNERSIVFSAREGELLDILAVEKTALTGKGKTWGAALQEVEPEIVRQVADFVAAVAWHGGGELEYVQEPSGKRWLIDVNPRFPAYIHGLTVCGRNLPQTLLDGTQVEASHRAHIAGQQFVRVIQEIPVTPAMRLPRLPEPGAKSLTGSGKHPSFQPELVKRALTSPVERQNKDQLRTQGQSRQGEMASCRPTRTTEGRSRSRRLSAMLEIFDRLELTCRDASDASGLTVRPAMSVKTDPWGDALRSFLDREWLIEVISRAELDWAILQGCPPSAVICNGPESMALVQDERMADTLAFADSLEALTSWPLDQRRAPIGIRLAPQRVHSRFGISLTSWNTWQGLVTHLAGARLPGGLAVHFHFAEDRIGPSQWRDLLSLTLQWCEELETATGHPITTLDIGGGWDPTDFQEILSPGLKQIAIQAAERLKGLTALILEPGKALMAPTAHYTTYVREVRERGNGLDIVVDASIADLPMTRFYAHEIEHQRCELRQTLTGGSDRILGSICMEDDILAQGVGFVSCPRPGDSLIFSGAGAYNASMAWRFAQGESAPSTTPTP